MSIMIFVYPVVYSQLNGLIADTVGNCNTNMMFCVVVRTCSNYLYIHTYIKYYTGRCTAHYFKGVTVCNEPMTISRWSVVPGGQQVMRVTDRG